MKPRRVCMVVHAYYPADETRVRREAEALVRNGFEVDVICLKDIGEKNFEIVNGIGVYRLPVKRHQGSRLIVYMFEYLAFFLLSSIMVLFRFMKKRYDIIQIHNPPDFLVFSALIPKLLGVKVIFDMHELTPELLLSKWRLKESNFYIKTAKLIERYCTALADHIIVIDTSFIKILTLRGVRTTKSSVIMNVADSSLFNTSYFSHKKKDMNKPFILMYHGALLSINGIDIAIRAVNILKNKIPSIQFKIYGRGEAMENLKKITDESSLNGYIKFEGFVPADKIPLLIEEADVGVIPRRKNILTDLAVPTKAFEYIVMGKPIVISRTSAVENIFDDSAVMFFEPGNEKDFARCILELYHNPQKRAELARNARKQYEPIRWEVMSKRYVELVNSLIKR